MSENCKQTNTPDVDEEFVPCDPTSSECSINLTPYVFIGTKANATQAEVNTAMEKKMKGLYLQIQALEARVAALELLH
jgi:hypothetical protein